MLTTNGKVAIAQLVYFITITPLILYCLWTHGRRKCLGWLFLFFFATVRVISSILTINQQSKREPPSTAVQVVSGIAISPLLVGIAGVMHESFTTIRRRQPWIFGWLSQILIHMTILGVLVLIILGNLAYVNKSNSAAEQSRGRIELIAGLFVVLSIWSFMAVQLGLSYLYQRATKAENQLSYACFVSMIGLLLRILYPLIGALINSDSWNPRNGGSLAAKLALSVVPEFVIALALTATGAYTRNISKEVLLQYRAGLQANDDDGVELQPPK